MRLPKGHVHLWEVSKQGLDYVGLDPYWRWLYAFEDQKYLDSIKGKYLSQTSKAILLLLVACWMAC